MESRVPFRACVRRWALQGVALICATTLGIWVGAASLGAYDPRLDEALAALQKAAALVEASSAGEVSAKAQRKFDRHLENALADIQDAMNHILAAGTAADADGSAQ
jgi:hypothetical protein